LEKETPVDVDNDGEVPAFLIQVATEPPGARLEGAGDLVVEGTRRHLEAAAELARTAAQTVGNVIREHAPDGGRIEFALTFEGEAGLPVLAKGKAGATLTITLEWSGATP
jgi:hypothetical protein